MPPNPDLPVKPLGRRFSQYYVPIPVYIGLDIEPDLDNGKCEYAISVHDGSYTTDYYSGTFDISCKGKCREDCMLDGVNKLLEVVRVFAMAQHYKIQIIAISRSLSEAIYQAQPAEGPSAASMFWRELDAIPFHVSTNAESSDERASAAVRKAVMWLSPQYPGNLPRVSVGYRHEVEVDFNGLIRLVDLIDYKRTVCSDTWRIISDMVTQYKNRKLRLAFFNSTPQGGGVALMRHALLRLYRLLGVEVHWYVARPKPEVFDITKRKFHNVLQGVAPPDVRLNDRDKQIFIDWSNDNAERFWLKPGGPIGNSDVIVIDDPQLVGVIPHIKKHSPKTRIIFRSHIEMRADLIRKFPDGPQAETWNFIWEFIQQADLFVSHPMENFVPDVVPRRDVVQMPATTDALDGLNKRIDAWSTEYYQSVFNRCCMDQGSNEVDWSRPYIVQVARFDPSKGIPDVLESYRLLRLKLADAGVDEYDAPQLVICGHGSIDDPDGTLIYEDTYRILHNAEYTDICPDIIVARLPPSDQLLDMVLSNAKVALQLSHREGFEVKVTEALHKGIPIVAYEAGGIPLQIVKDQDGFLLPIGDVAGVADRMFQLVTNPQLHRDMSTQAKSLVTEEYFTVWNAIGWLHLSLELTNEVGLDGESKGMADEEGTLRRNSGLGNNVKVSDHWRKKYSYAPSTTTAPPRV